MGDRHKCCAADREHELPCSLESAASTLNCDVTDELISVFSGRRHLHGPRFGCSHAPMEPH